MRDPLAEALYQIGQKDIADEACSICHAHVRPDRRDRHLKWHESLIRHIERDRLPEVYGSKKGAVAQKVEVLQNEVSWLQESYEQALELGTSNQEYLRGYAAAISWVRFHSENPHLLY